VPSAQTSVEGDGNNQFPFGAYEIRYQQVYGGTEFPSSPIFITAISFRLDAQYGQAFATTLPNVQISLSTTSASPDALSLTFADNVGADETVVHNGPLSLSSTFSGPAAGPKAFDITIPISPFFYNSRQGNLLLEVRKPEAPNGGAPNFDSVHGSFDAVSRVNTVFDANAVVANNVDSDGLVTQFTYTFEVPEPASWMLVVCSLPMLVRRGRYCTW